MDGVLDRVRARVGSQVFESAESRRRFLVHVAVVVVALAVLGALLRPHLSLLTDAERLQAFIRGFGVWGPVVLVLVQALQVVVAPIPGQVLAVVAGYLYGTWWGTLYNLVGITVGSAVAFWLSKRYGRSYVESIVHEDTLAKVDAVDDAHVRATLFVLFLFPGLPDDVLCFAGGLTRVPLWQLVLIALLGRAPAFFLVNVLGEYIDHGQFGLAAALVAALVALSVLGYLARDRIFAVFGAEQ